MVNAETWEGVNSLLDNYVELRPTDTIVLAYTPDSYEAVAWVSAAVALRNMEFRRVPMLPLVDPDFSSAWRRRCRHQLRLQVDSSF